MSEENGWYVYMVRCHDGSLYTGVARDPWRRLDEHNGLAPGGARYTRARRPVTLAWTEPAPTRAAACRREAELKQWPRARKLALIPE